MRPVRRDPGPGQAFEGQRFVMASCDHVPELRAKATPRQVEFYVSDYGLDAIREELRDNRELLEAGGETGGWLFGRRDTFRKYQLHPTRLGLDGERSHHSVLLGLQPMREGERRAAASGVRDLFFLGSWHTHPYAKGYAEPSRSDRRNTLARLDRGESAYACTATFGLDLIITPDPMRAYSRPHFHLWLTDRSGPVGKAATIPALFPETLPCW